MTTLKPVYDEGHQIGEAETIDEVRVLVQERRGLSERAAMMVVMTWLSEGPKGFYLVAPAPCDEIIRKQRRIKAGEAP